MIKAIQTKAYGRFFSSRLEARYAVFLTALGVSWEHEPEGFELKSGRYLPDFFLPRVNGGTWIEVKPHGKGCYFAWCNGPPLDDGRMTEFAEKIYKGYPINFFVARGIPDPTIIFPGQGDPGALESPYDPHMWCVCGCGRTVGIEFDGRGDRIECGRSDCARSPHGDKGYSANHPLIVKAATAALSARFERGEATCNS